MPVLHASFLNGVRVLIVDDNLDFCAWMTYVLELYGVEVRSALTVEQGLSAFVELRPHLVLSDVVMPDEDGYSLLRKIRQLEAGQNQATPVIAVTALAEADAGVQALDSRFNLWFVKPMDIDPLIKAIAQLAPAPSARVFSQDLTLPLSRIS